MSGSEFGGGSSGSSRRGKKSGSHNSEKPKQPQRGLGVAQLEKIRLHSQMSIQQEEMKMQTYAAMQSPAPQPPHFAYSSSASSTPYGYSPNIMMDMGDMERGNLRFGKTGNQPMWNPSLGFSDTQSYGPLGMGATRHFLNNIEDPEEKNEEQLVGHGRFERSEFRFGRWGRAEFGA